MSLLAVTSVAAQADIAKELETAQATLAAGDYTAAYQQYRQIADQEDNPLAAFTVGLFYQLGWGRPVDQAEACRWFAQTAESTIPAALLAHADCLRSGARGKPDAEQAAVYYQRAADQGLPYALCNLAEMYMTGEGLEPDPKRAIELCSSVAEQGYTPAMTRTGRFYLEGDMSVQDTGMALQWFVNGANSGDPEAMNYLGQMMRDNQVADTSLEDARLWFEKAAALGYVPAYFPTAELYYLAEGRGENGTIAAEDLAKLYMWLQLTVQASPKQAERERASEILEKVAQVMPESWKPQLDQQVDAHLQKFASAQPTAVPAS